MNYYIALNYRSKNKSEILQDYAIFRDVVDYNRLDEISENGFIEISKYAGVSEYIIDLSEDAVNRCYENLSLYRFLYNTLREKLRDEKISYLLK